MRYAVAVSLSLLLVACEPVSGPAASDSGGGGGVDAGGSDAAVADGAVPDSSAADQARPDTAVADSAQPDGAAPDAGAPDTSAPDAAVPDIQGFDVIVDFDAGSTDLDFVEYSGSAEEGVVCGGETCAADVSCCLGFSASCEGALGCLIAPEIQCDDQDDCAAGEECCVTGTGALDFAVACVAEGSCAGGLVCINTAECGIDGICCSTLELTSRGLDFGWCESGTVCAGN